MGGNAVISFHPVTLAKPQIIRSQHSVVDFVVEVSKALKNKIAVMVYVLLCDLSCKSTNKERTIVASHEQIANRLDISVRSSARAIRFLKLKGYIDAYRLKSTGKKYQPNTIKVKCPEHLVYKILEYSDCQSIPLVHLTSGESDDCSTSY